jgi:hypothetical protein
MRGTKGEYRQRFKYSYHSQINKKNYIYKASTIFPSLETANSLGKFFKRYIDDYHT